MGCCICLQSHVYLYTAEIMLSIYHAFFTQHYGIRISHVIKIEHITMVTVNKTLCQRDAMSFYSC